MAKETALWDDSALIDAFNAAMNKYRDMHKKPGKDVGNGGSSATANDEHEDEPCRVTETSRRSEERDISATSAIDSEFYSSLPGSREAGESAHSQQDYSAAEISGPKPIGVGHNEFSMQMNPGDSSNVQNMEYSHLVNHYQNLEQQRHEVLQQLYQMNGWNYQDTNGQVSTNAPWTGYGSSQCTQDGSYYPPYLPVQPYCETCNVAVLEQNVFMMNSVSKSGGAVFQLKCPGSYLSNTFARNSGQNGGAIWHNNLRSLNHTLNLFIQNTAINGSGGIELNQVAQMVVNGCNFTSNRGQKGGAIYSQDVTGSTSGSFFGFNQVTTNGGALFRGTSTGDVSGNTFLNNTANLDGGAIYESHVDGNINDNIFQLPATGNNIRGVFRTICSGSVTNNSGLISSQIANQNPVSG